MKRIEDSESNWTTSTNNTIKSLIIEITNMQRISSRLRENPGMEREEWSVDLEIVIIRRIRLVSTSRVSTSHNKWLRSMLLLLSTSHSILTLSTRSINKANIKDKAMSKWDMVKNKTPEFIPNINSLKRPLQKRDSLKPTYPIRNCLIFLRPLDNIGRRWSEEADFNYILLFINYKMEGKKIYFIYEFMEESFSEWVLSEIKMSLLYLGRNKNNVLVVSNF